MDTTTIILIIIWTLEMIPLLFILITRSLYKRSFLVSKMLSYALGFLISINGNIRVGKTSLQSGLKHIFEEEIQIKLENLILLVKQTYKHLDFAYINKYLDTCYLGVEFPQFDSIYEVMFQDLKSKNYEIDHSLIFNFISSSTTIKNLKDYMFAYFVLNYRCNYVQSKTSFYSHITGNYSLEYDISNQKIHDAYKNKDYAIYDFMVEVIDEVSDEQNAMSRLNDVKEESGDKEYHRKYGQIHQERNRLITTKQDSSDQVKKIRNLTQSHIWIAKRVEDRGNYVIFYNILSSLFNIVYFFYGLFFVNIPFMFLKTFKKIEIDIEQYKQHRYDQVNFKRKMDNYLLHFKWYLSSLAYNVYYIHVYSKDEDVPKRDPSLFDKIKLVIPKIYCFGTYDTHGYKNIQAELEKVSERHSTEKNVYVEKPFFDESIKKEGDNDVSSLEFL